MKNLFWAVVDITLAGLLLAAALALVPVALVIAWGIFGWPERQQ